MYNSLLSKLTLNKEKSDVNIKYKNILHELMHAATTERNEIGEPVKSGFTLSGKSGEGLDEGATEYFAQKLYSKLGRPEIPVIYRGEVNIIKGLVSIYGETVILDAMLNGTEKLENLMKNDGQDYSELRDLVDKYQVNKNNKLYEKAEESYNEAEQIIEKIKLKRKLEKTSKELNMDKNYTENENMKTCIKEEER